LVAHIDGVTWGRVFENRVPRKIFESKRAEVNVQWRRLYNEELNDM
jgi:hypothetical protein